MVKNNTLNCISQGQFSSALVQFIGKDGVDKRVNVLATALYNQMDLYELEHLELSYAPPYNNSWDPSQQAVVRKK